MATLTSDRTFNLTSEPNMGLYKRTSRILNPQLGYEALIPKVNPPTILGTSNLETPTLGNLGGLQNKLASTTIDVGASTTPKTGKGLATAAGIASMAGGVFSTAGDIMSSFKKKGPTNVWGIEAQTAGGNKNEIASSTLKDAGTYASMGASLGSMAGPIGTVVGGAIGAIGGGIMGLLKGKKKVKEESKEYKDNTQAAYESYNQKANASQYAALAKYGTKLKINEKLKTSKHNAVSWHGKTFKLKSGGKLNSLGKVNIIPSGTLHKENNNLGQKDKGLPIIDENGNKVFEIEREELILRLKTTKDVETLVNKYKKSHNAKHLIDLGKLLSKEIMTNTHDYSGKFGLEVK